jgi:hypothetical protein
MRRDAAAPYRSSSTGRNPRRCSRAIAPPGPEQMVRWDALLVGSAAQRKEAGEGPGQSELDLGKTSVRGRLGEHERRGVSASQGIFSGIPTRELGRRSIGLTPDRR